MNKTEKLKNIILSKYNSIREFSKVVAIPSTTLTSALDKGIGGMAVDRMIKICDVLSIDIKTFEPLESTILNTELSQEKKTLFENYNKLNNLGKNKLVEYSNDLTETPKYIENNINDDTNDLITATKVTYKSECDDIANLKVAEKNATYVPTTLAAHAKDNQDIEANKRDIEKIKAIMAKKKIF